RRRRVARGVVRGRVSRVSLRRRPGARGPNTAAGAPGGPGAAGPGPIGGDRPTSVDDITPGTIVLVRPGEKIPLDGKVVAGTSAVNQAPVTGESLPIDKAPGDEVFAGTINGRGAIDVEVTRLRRD